MKKHLGALLRCFVSISILAYIFNNIFKKESAEHPWTEGAAKLWAIVYSLNPWWFIGGLAFMGLICLVNIVRWQIILRVQKIEISLWRATELFFIGQFFNSFMLGSTGGDVVKAYYAAQETHHKKAEAVMTVIIDRLVGLVGLFVVASAMMLVNIRVLFDNQTLRPMALSVVAILGVLLFVLFIGFWPGLGKALHKWRERLLHDTTISTRCRDWFGAERATRWSERFAAIRANIKKMIGAYQAYAAHKPALIQTFLLALVTHVSLIFSSLCIGKSLAIAVNPQLYFIMVPAINCIAAVPISISGLGVREMLFVAAFGAGGVPEEKALLLSLLCFSTSLFYSVVGGIIYLFFDRARPNMADLKVSDELAEPEPQNTK